MARAEHDWYGRQDYPEIESDRQVVDVQQIESAIGVKRWVVACFDWPEPGHTRFDSVPTHQLKIELGDLLGKGRSRPHQAHRPGEYVEELRNLVDAESA